MIDLKEVKPEDLKAPLEKFWKLATEKTELLRKNYKSDTGSPVITKAGKYVPQGWTDWTQGFQFGIPLLIFDATGNAGLLEKAKEDIKKKMPAHLSHFGVHDHGFNTISTYGNLLRLGNQGKIQLEKFERDYYELAIKMSASVQARRWSSIEDGGFIYSFNGPHSLFVDTIRSCRVLLLATKLGHQLYGENDQKIDLLDRALKHGMATAKYGIFYGETDRTYDVWGRTAHESVFNMNDGRYRCPNSQQGFSGFTTWTRGLAWAMLGFTEILEFIREEDLKFEGRQEMEASFMKAAKATCDFFIEYTPTDGIPYWDTGAPTLYKLGDYLSKPSDPYNDFEPVDSSATAIGAQGLIRLADLIKKDDPTASKKYRAAALNGLKSLLNDPYLSTDPSHEGILLHGIYHRPNNWDYIPKGSKIPNGESCMWGDYHMTELCLKVWRSIQGEDEYRFF
ncbi:MAG: glycosyl hydrolase [Bacteroidota bacterium]